MTKTSQFLLIAAIIIGGIIITPRAWAYRGDQKEKGPNYTEARHEAMERAFKTSDYNTWKSLMVGRGRITQVINKDNFAQLAKVHELMEDGRVEEANQIRNKLGLGNGRGLCSK